MGVVIAAVLVELLLILLLALAGEGRPSLYGSYNNFISWNRDSKSNFEYFQPQRHVAVPLPAGERRPQAQRPVDPTKPGDCIEKTGLIIKCLVFNQRKCKQKWLNPHCWCPSHIFHPLQLQKFVNCTKLLSLEVASISVPKAPSISVIQPNLLTYSRG